MCKFGNRDLRVEAIVTKYKSTRPQLITKETANYNDLSIELPLNLSEDSASNLLVDSFMKFQDISFDEIPPNQVVRKLKRECVELLNHIINIKVSHLINRMDNKEKYIVFNTIIKCARPIFPRIKIKGVHLCEKEIEENFHGDLLNYTVKKSAKAKVDINKWEFEFQPSDD
ncbi:hypothetical protein QTP88_011894 [Uroleucon formosanum]